MDPPFFRAPPNNRPVARASFQKPVAIPKAPIVNPYEKFTQPQFDAWIGDITGALRGALGYRAEVPQKPKARTKWHIPASHSSDEAPDASYEDEDADEELEDSFAEVKARGAAAKGKGRDPREGPGLGRGDRAAPIEIDMDSGEEEDQDQEEEEEEEEEEPDEEESWDENEGMGSDDEEEENALRNGESSARAHARYKKYAERYDDRAEQEEDEYEEEDVGPDAVEVISDEELEDKPHTNGLQIQEGEEDGEEYSDEENAFPAALSVAPPKRTLVTEEGGYSDDGEETGSESENGAAGSSPPRQVGPRTTEDVIFEDEDEEDLEDEIDPSPRRPQRGEPEVFTVDDSDEEEPAGEDEEEERLADDGEEDEQDEHGTLRASLHLSTQQDDQDDVLPGSSPILSSPIEAEQSFPSFPSENQNHEVFNVDEDDEDMNDAQNHSQSFDWNNPPAFGQGVPASGPGHLATPVEDDNVVETDGYPPVFRTSDLSTFESQSQTESGSNDIPLQFHPLEFDEQYGFTADSSSSSFLSAPGYFVTEADEQVLPENLDYSDAYTASRDISVDPQHFTVEEAFTDQEPDDRAMSFDVVTVDGEMEGADVGAENYNAILDEIRSTQYPSAELVAAAFEATFSDVVPAEESQSQSQLLNVPMPISADPAVHDPFGSRPATPPRPPTFLGLPGSPLLISPVGTPTGRPTPVAMPVPASFLKVMHKRQDSGLFTPGSEDPFAETTPPAGEGVQAEPVVEVVEEASVEENTTNVNGTNDDSVEVTEVEEGAEDPVESFSAETIDATVDAEAQVEEPREEQDLIPDAAEVEPRVIEEISSSTEEMASQRDEENSADATLPQDDAPSAPELDTAAPTEHTEPTEDPIVVDDSHKPPTNGNTADLAIAYTEDLTPNTQDEQDASSSSAFPEKMTLVANAAPVLELDPYPYSLSTPGEHEHLDPMEAISGESSSAGDGDGEERTDGERDDASSAATSQERHDGVELDGMELQYPDDVKGVDVEESNPVEGAAVVEGADVEEQDVKVREDVGNAEVDEVLGVEVEGVDASSAEHSGGEMDGMELHYPEDAEGAVEGDVEDVEESNVVEESADTEAQDVEVREDVDDADVDAILDAEVEEAGGADDLKSAVDVDVEEAVVAVEGADDVGLTVDVVVGGVEEANVEVEDVETADDAERPQMDGEELQTADVEVAEVESIEGADEEGSDESETDADGVDDPDYEDSSSAASAAGEQAIIDADVEERSPDAAEASAAEEDTPRELETLQETNGVVESAETPYISEVNEDAHEQENGSVVKKMDYVQVPEASSSLAGAQKEPSPLPTQELEVDDDEIIAASPPESLKRKREHSSTGGNMGKMAESRLLRTNGKGKGKAKEEYVDDDGASSTSSASSAARLLDPGSADSSRASSVVSARSSVVVPTSSPSLPRTNSIIRVARMPPKLPPPPPPAPPPPPLMHAHSHNRPAHPPPMSRHATTQQRVLQRTPSRASIHEESPPPTPSSSSMPAPPRRAPPAAGSPVTRSNCRYRKISLPENDEDKMGRRVFFVVPGCSLGDSELMKEEFILDLGDATQEEGDTMIKDLDELQLSPYLIGIIRQLVGVDILREQEAYYLPRPGEGRRKPQRRGKSKLRISSAGSGSFAAGSEASGSGMGMMSPSSMRSPASVVSSRPPHSSSTASTQTKRGRKKAVPSSNRGSPTPSWVMSQGGDESTDEDESPAAKKIRAAEEEGIAAAASGSPLRTRRSKRMDREAAEYKPDPTALEAAAESSEEDEDKDKGKRKKRRRGVKRGRHSEAVPAQDGGDERKTKKLKTQESIGGSAS